MASRKTLSKVARVSGLLALVCFLISAPIGLSFFIFGAEQFPVSQELLATVVAITGSGLGLSFAVWLVSTIGLLITGRGSESSEEEEEKVEEKGPRDHLAEFNKANRYAAAVFGVLAAIGIAGPSLASATSGTPVAVLVGFLRFAVSMLGGTGVMLLNAAWFGAAWYGIKNYNASEAWAAGIIGWALFTLSGVMMLSASIGALAIVVAGLKILSFGWKSRGETELKFLEDEVEGTVLEDYL